MFVWQAHKGKVRSMAFSPDGKVLATATGSSERAWLWNPQTGELVRRLSFGTEVGVLSVGFAPGAPLFAAGGTATVRLWDADTWRELAVLRTASWDGGYYAVAFSGGPTPRLAAANPQRAFVWDNLPRRRVNAAREPGASYRLGKTPFLDFALDGETLAMSVLDEVVLWNLDGRKPTLAIPQDRLSHAGPVKFSPDGTRLAVGARNHVSVYRLDAKEPVVCKGHTAIVWSVGWSADGKALFTASADGTARQWNPDTGAELRTFEWGIGEIISTAFSADGLLGAAASREGKVVVWDLDA